MQKRTPGTNLIKPNRLPSSCLMEYATVTNFEQIDANLFRTVLIDLDNTLYRYEPCHQAGLEAAWRMTESQLGDLPDFMKQYEAAQKAVKARIPEHGASHSRLLYFQNLLESIDPAAVYSLAPQLESAYWDTFLTKMELVPGALVFLADCRTRGTKVVVVSDLTARIQCQKLVALGLDHLIDFLVTSEEAGAEKPAAAPFRLGLEKAGGSAAEAVMIGDSLSRDMAGATALGIHAIHLSHTKRD